MYLDLNCNNIKIKHITLSQSEKQQQQKKKHGLLRELKLENYNEKIHWLFHTEKFCIFKF